MLNQQTSGKLKELRLNGMAEAFEMQLSTPVTHSLSFEERFGLIIDQECTHRADQRLKRLLKGAKLQLNACVEDIEYVPGRGMDRSQIASLISCDWVSRGLNLILSGATGTGKTWLACAFGNKACRLGKTVLFQRIPLLLEDLKLAHADGSFRKRLAQLAKFDLLILDDFGSGAITAQGRADLLEVVDSRVNGRSITVTSQIPVEKWHDYLSSGNPTAADAILDRLVSGSVRVPLLGESMRKRMKNKFDQ